VIFDLPGFWGPPTATVDWCEANYEHSFFVCEMINTVSSLAMVLAGALGWALHRRSLERRFLLAFFAVTVVGLGSIAFHATLRFELQMLDELPMLYSALIMVFILLENGPVRRFGRWFPMLLAGYGVVLTCLSAFTRGKLQFYLFHTSFGSMEVFALFGVYAICRRSHSPVVRRLFRLGMSSYVAAIIFWFTDIQACSVLSRLPYELPNPQFHAVWHLLVSSGMYLLTLVIAYDRLERLGQRPALRSWLGFLPVIAGPNASPAAVPEKAWRDLRTMR
jgi:dihydroceramidase